MTGSGKYGEAGKNQVGQGSRVSTSLVNLLLVARPVVGKRDGEACTSTSTSTSIVLEHPPEH